MKKRRDLALGFTEDTGWIVMSKKGRRERGWYPNYSLYLPAESVIQVATVRSGKDKDWSLNLRALADHITAQDEGAVRIAYVTLWEEDPKTGKVFVAGETVKNVDRFLRSAPETGNFGEYYWIDRNFRAVRNLKTVSRIPERNWPA